MLSSRVSVSSWLYIQRPCWIAPQEPGRKRPIREKDFNFLFCDHKKGITPPIRQGEWGASSLTISFAFFSLKVAMPDRS